MNYISNTHARCDGLIFWASVSVHCFLFILGRLVSVAKKSRNFDYVSYRVFLITDNACTHPAIAEKSSKLPFNAQFSLVSLSNMIYDINF